MESFENVDACGVSVANLQMTVFSFILAVCFGFIFYSAQFSAAKRKFLFRFRNFLFGFDTFFSGLETFLSGFKTVSRYETKVSFPVSKLSFPVSKLCHVRSFSCSCSFQTELFPENKSMQQCIAHLSFFTRACNRKGLLSMERERESRKCNVSQ